MAFAYVNPRTPQDLRSKLQAAEQLCEELMDENEDYKKEIRTLEEEIEEMQDNFREEQADEYRDLKRELEQTAKNCRVLQFKLKKAERRSDSVSDFEFQSNGKRVPRLVMDTYMDSFLFSLSKYN